VSGGVHVWNLDWLSDDSPFDAALEWERAQLAAMRTIDDDGRERDIPLHEWRRRRRAFRE
jgi:hypothetical protein